MNHEQLRIISELFMEGRKSYEGMGFMENEENGKMVESNYKKSVEKAQDVAFQVLRDEVEETETGKNRKEKQEMLQLLKDAVNFILFDCHKWEEKAKGKYETRRQIQIDNNGNRDIKGSGQCNELAKKLYAFIYKIEGIKLWKE